MNKTRQKILRQVALYAVVWWSLGLVAECVFASGSEDVSADGGSVDGWQALAVGGDQQDMTAPAAPQAEQKSNVKAGVAKKSAQSASSPEMIEGSSATQAGLASYGAVDQTVATVSVAPGASTPQEQVKSVWHVDMADGTFQKLFGRWATMAGWRSRWDVPQDIPVIAEYTFEGSFTDAVFSVTDSTDGTDMPVHPCFYTNNLVRIVPVSVVCNPANN